MENRFNIPDLTPMYEAVRDWYYTQLNDTAIFDSDREIVPQLIDNSATADEI